MLPKHLQDLLAKEDENRAITWLGVTEEICGVPVLPLTPRMRNDLLLARNAFFAAGKPTARDVANFLWRCSPHYRRPIRPALLRRNGRFRLLALWRAFGSIQTAIHYLTIEDFAGTAPLAITTGEIIDSLIKTFQDRPASDGAEGEDKKPSLVPDPVPHWMDSIILFCTSRLNMRIGEVLDTPFRQIFQLHRAEIISRGERPIDPSSAAIADWIFDEARKMRAHYG